MEYPMKVNGLNIIEIFLSNVLNLGGWVVTLGSLGVLVWLVVGRSQSVGEATFLVGALVAASLLTGLVLLLGGSGTAQNRPAVEIGAVLAVLCGFGWLFIPDPFARISALVLVLAGLATLSLERFALYVRYRPRFFSLRQFETLVRAVDTMLESDGQQIIDDVQVAINTDHMMASLETPLRGDLRTALMVTEWLLPVLTIGRPLPFSYLGVSERRRAVEKTIEQRGPFGLFRVIARTLKILTCAGYFGSSLGMAQVGYLPFEQRERAKGVNLTPSHHPDPFPTDSVRTGSVIE